METLLCEVIGCGRPAVWARVEKAQSNREDFLCAVCQVKLRMIKPGEAGYYRSCDMDASPSFAGFDAMRREGDSEDCITIGA